MLQENKGINQKGGRMGTRGLGLYHEKRGKGSPQNNGEWKSQDDDDAAGLEDNQLTLEPVRRLQGRFQGDGIDSIPKGKKYAWKEIHTADGMFEDTLG